LFICDDDEAHLLQKPKRSTEHLCAAQMMQQLGYQELLPSRIGGDHLAPPWPNPSSGPVNLRGIAATQMVWGNLVWQW
jgi:4'-phosphopantetheinyl transferase EntD